MHNRGPMFHAHTDLFPADIKSQFCQEARRDSFRHRAGQAFEDKDICSQVLAGKPLRTLIDHWTHLNPERLRKILDWYGENETVLTKDEKRAVIFFGTFSIETLNINVRTGTTLKAVVRQVWDEHVKLFDAFTREEIQSFVHRVMLMSEAPLVPSVLGDGSQDNLMRIQAYRHFRKLYQIQDVDTAMLDRDANIYADIIVQDRYARCNSDLPRSSELQAMFEDILETFNLSRRFHRQVFGEPSIRPDIIYS